MNTQRLLNSLTLAILAIGLTAPSVSFAQQRGNAATGRQANSRIAFPNQTARKNLTGRLVTNNSKKSNVGGKIRSTGKQNRAQYYGGQNVSNKVRSNRPANFDKAKSITRDKWIGKIGGAPNNVRPTNVPNYVPTNGPVQGPGNVYQQPPVAPTSPVAPPTLVPGYSTPSWPSHHPLSVGLPFRGVR